MQTVRAHDYTGCPATNQVAPAQLQSNFVTTTTTQSQAQSINVSSTKGTPSDPLRANAERSHKPKVSAPEVLSWSPFHASRWSPEWSPRGRRRRRSYKSLRADLNCSLTLQTPISSEVNKTYGSQLSFRAIAALPNSIRDPLRRRLDSRSS